MHFTFFCILIIYPLLVENMVELVCSKVSISCNIIKTNILVYFNHYIEGYAEHEKHNVH